MNYSECHNCKSLKEQLTEVRRDAAGDKERVEKLDPEVHALRARVRYLESERDLMIEESKNIKNKIVEIQDIILTIHQ